MRLEHVDRRILGAVRFIDATTRLQVPAPLIVKAEGVTWIRNRQGQYVISGTPNLQSHVRSFRQPPTTPPLDSESVELEVFDPSGQFLPRRHTIRLPRDPDPQNAHVEGSLFHVTDVPVFPSPAAKTAPGWAVIRATVVEEGMAEARLPGALIRVLRTDDSQLLARGLSEWRGRTRGEAMVAVPGIPITTWGEGNGDNAGDDDGPVVVHEIQATLQVIVDPQFNPEDGDIPDPDDLEARRNELPSSSVNVQLASGQTLTMVLEVRLP